MEAHYSLEVVKKILETCKNQTNGFVCQNMCPYAKMKDCLEVLHDDALYYIKKNPDISQESSKQQEMPGIKDQLSNEAVKKIKNGLVY